MQLGKRISAPVLYKYYNAILNYNLSFANLEKEIGVPIKFSEDMIINISPSEI